MNRVLCILKDMESGITLMKDKDDKTEWTQRDLIRMKKKNLIKGYDVEYGNNFVILDMSEIQYMYLIGEEQCKKVEEMADADEPFEEENSLRWKDSMPQPGWNPGDNGVMFG